MIRSVSASVNALTPQLENAAANCGAPPVQAFLAVTLSAVMPRIITGALLSFVLAFSEFLVSLFLTDSRTVTLPVQIYDSIRNVITPDLAVVSVLYTVVALVVVWLLVRQLETSYYTRYDQNTSVLVKHHHSHRPSHSFYIWLFALWSDISMMMHCTKVYETIDINRGGEMRMKLGLKRILTALAAVVVLSGFASTLRADELSDRIAAGEPIRLGFATAIPWAYPGDSNEPLGFVNALTLVVLEEMGITKYETSVNEWSGLIPGLQADRYDIITGGMYILKSRCENINFTDPIGFFGDAFLVPAGNPKGIETYQDVIKTGAKLVTGAGFNTVEAAKKEGVPEDQMMLVAGEVEILAAMRAGRADAAIQTYFGALEHVKQSDGKFEVTDPGKLPKWTQNWVGIGMRKSDTDFLAAFNEAMAKVIGGEKWMAAVEPYGYTKSQLPGPDASTEFACENR